MDCQLCNIIKNFVEDFLFNNINIFLFINIFNDFDFKLFFIVFWKDSFNGV